MSDKFMTRLLERELEEIRRADAAGKHEASGQGATVVLIGDRPEILRDYQTPGSGGSASAVCVVDRHARAPLGDEAGGVLISGEIFPHERHGDEVTLDADERRFLRDLFREVEKK